MSNSQTQRLLAKIEVIPVNLSTGWPFYVRQLIVVRDERLATRIRRAKAMTAVLLTIAGALLLSALAFCVLITTDGLFPPFFYGVLVAGGGSLYSWWHTSPGRAAKELAIKNPRRARFIADDEYIIAYRRGVRTAKALRTRAGSTARVEELQQEFLDALWHLGQSGAEMYSRAPMTRGAAPGQLKRVLRKLDWEWDRSRGIEPR